MFGLRKRRHNQCQDEQVRIETADIHIAHAWGMTLTQWLGLDDEARRYCREHVTRADKVGATS